MGAGQSGVIRDLALLFRVIMNIWNSLSDYTDRRAKAVRYQRYLAEPKPEEKEATPPLMDLLNVHPIRFWIITIIGLVVCWELLIGLSLRLLP